jgi:hypothetical protein
VLMAFESLHNRIQDITDYIQKAHIRCVGMMAAFERDFTAPPTTTNAVGEVLLYSLSMLGVILGATASQPQLASLTPSIAAGEGAIAANTSGLSATDHKA